jgi:hypothetical protein
MRPMETVTGSHPASGEDTVTTADLVAKAAEIKPAAYAQASRAAAGILLGAGAVPDQVRAVSLSWCAGIADAMEEVLRLRATCATAVQLVPCGLDGCGASAGLACDGGTGVHVVRLGSAMKRRVITGGQLVEALQSAVVFTGATVIRPDGAR